MMNVVHDKVAEMMYWVEHALSLVLIRLRYFAAPSLDSINL